MPMSNPFTRDPQPRVQYLADGSRTSFAFPFVVEASDDLLVYVNELPAEGFAVDGLGDPDGGQILYGQPPAAGTTVTLVRRTESIRETEFVDGAPFRAATVNAEFDRLVMLIQEDRDADRRALRIGPAEAEADLCLPPPAERANRLFGFDSAGAPAVFGADQLPASGDVSGALVTASGASTARMLGEHLAAVVDVRDFGAQGDGTTDDAVAFQAALTAAAARRAAVYVPAGPVAYVLGSGITVDGVRMLGDGPGSVLKLAPAIGVGVRLTGERRPPAGRTGLDRLAGGSGRRRSFGHLARRDRDRRRRHRS
ncbi:MAG: glycosyl hydrolase family 28-related protein, partial [Geminicoccaceae bacterium]|nr:glycosyl hydrolase family 28-related protein [Geminicoccaceae bacterium]